MLNIIKKIFGSGNEREISRISKIVEKINSKEESLKNLSLENLKNKYLDLKIRYEQSGELDNFIIDVFALTREVSKKTLKLRPFDVQLIGGIVLHEGKIAEMKTGEGKTLVATLPVVLNALDPYPVHLITVNDYLARRDALWMAPIYLSLDLKVGVLNNGISYTVKINSTKYELVEAERSKAYECDVIYGTNSEFGFDYLRDNMKYSNDEICQSSHSFAIVDEVDSILIDEARTPLIISGPTDSSLIDYKNIYSLCKKINKDEIAIDEKTRQVFINDAGSEKLQKLFNIDNLYDPKNLSLLHSINQSLRAINIYTRDKDYVVQDDKVIIVDEFTGRLMPSRRWSEGLHQAVEAKENVKIEEENQTFASITIQNYFRMYEKLSGMTGTADTEALEFQNIYNLRVVVIPTNLPMMRKDLNDLIYRTEKEKIDAIVSYIKKYNKDGNPVLIGTVSVEKSEQLSKYLSTLGIKHNVLNAKNHESEAEVISKAGEKRAVTIATNMAGRGTDIKLGGANNDDTRQREEVLRINGLVVLGSERHESRRIDNQLRGRSGRQGDPGLTQFFVSMEDELMRLFGSERISNMMTKLGWKEGEPIEHKMITNSLENAQKKVESRNFEIRKHLLEYDDVQNKQREIIYKLRNRLLRNSEIDEVLKEIKDDALYSFQPLLDNEISFEDKKNMFNFLTEDEILNLSDTSQLELVIDKKIENKKILLGDMFQSISKFVLLSTLDMKWKDHLLSMDYLRESVSLRGYGQQNPLREYKKEGFEIFDEMIDNFNIDALVNFLEVVPIKDEDLKEIEKSRDIDENLSYNDSDSEKASKNNSDEIKRQNNFKISEIKAKEKRRQLEKKKRKQRKRQRK
tara:strand:+ start:2499 stop:5069 length:2571 start_codon:yes stop_codon:yes gene_type:complete